MLFLCAMDKCLYIFKIHAYILKSSVIILAAGVFGRCLGHENRDPMNGIQFSSVQLLSHVQSLWPRGLQHTRPPWSSPTPRVYSSSCPLSWWCYPTISSSVVPFSSLLQSFPASGSFQMSQFFTSGGQSIGVSAYISPSNEHPGLISFRIDWLDLLAVQGTL